MPRRHVQASCVNLSVIFLQWGFEVGGPLTRSLQLIKPFGKIIRFLLHNLRIVCLGRVV